MNLWLRALYVLIASLFRPRIADILSPSILKLHVWPNDLDTNFHMNNGRYLTIMDLGRFDFVLRSGMMRVMLQQKSVPILGAAQIRYRLPLDAFEPYTLETRVLCWDAKWCYLEQRFIVRRGEKTGAVAAIALVKGSFYNQKRKEMVPTADLLDAIGYHAPSPPLPTHIVSWQAAEENLRSVTR